MLLGDVEKMVGIGLVWGATNALIRRGALLWDHHNRHRKHNQTGNPRNTLGTSLSYLIGLLLFWQYSLPFLVNLSASATFFAILSHAPISLAVPVTNATTFAATAAFGMLLGEGTRVGPALLGTAFIVAGVLLCIS